jgi:hypothetical protein
MPAYPGRPRVTHKKREELINSALAAQTAGERSLRAPGRPELPSQ